MVRTEPSQGLNTGSTPVSATKSFKIIYLQNGCTGLALQAPSKDVAKARFQIGIRIPETPRFSKGASMWIAT